MVRLAARLRFPAGLIPGLGGGVEARGNPPGRDGGRGHGWMHPPGDFQDKKDVRFGALGPGLQDQETGLLFPKHVAGVEQFAQNLIDDGGPVLVHVPLNFETGR
ncbi:MAG: hypothetical protein ACE15F_23910 [bacterium]